MWYLAADFSLGHLAEWVSFLQHKVTPSAPSVRTLEETLNVQTTPKNEGLTLHLLESLYKFFENLLEWEICLFSPIHLLFNYYLHQYGLMDVYICGYNLRLPCLLCCSHYLNFCYRVLFQLTYSCHFCVCVMDFLISDTTKCSRLIL